MPILNVRDSDDQEWYQYYSIDLITVAALANVSAGSPADGDVLIYNSGSGIWTTGSAPGGTGTSDVQAIGDLEDVDVSGVGDGDILQFNSASGSWEATPMSGSSGDMYKSVYDSDDDGIVEEADTAGSAASAPWAGITGKPSEFDPIDHASDHENGGGDEISVAGLSGVLADRQDANKLYGRSIETGIPQDGQVLVWRSVAAEWQYEEQSGSGGGTSGSGNLIPIVGDDLTAQIPDVADHFDTTYIFELNTLEVFYNGVRQQSTKITEDGDGGGFTTDFSPVAGDTLVCNYYQTSGSASSQAQINIKEQDETPALSNITTIVVGNGDLTDLGGGLARIKTAADVYVGPSDQDVLMIQIFS